MSYFPKIKSLLKRFHVGHVFLEEPFCHRPSGLCGLYGEDVRLWGEKARLAWGSDLKIGAGGEIGRPGVSRPLRFTDKVGIFQTTANVHNLLANVWQDLERGVKGD